MDEQNKESICNNIPVDEDTKTTDTDITIVDPKQQRFIHLYLTGQYKIATLASLLDLHPNTLHNWLRKPEIKSIIAEYQKDEHEIIETRLKALRVKALEKMSDLIDSPIDGISFQASKDVLDRTGHKAKQEIKKEVTVKSFEEKLNEVIRDTVDAEYTIIE